MLSDDVSGLSLLVVAFAPALDQNMEAIEHLPEAINRFFIGIKLGQQLLQEDLPIRGFMVLKVADTAHDLDHLLIDFIQFFSADGIHPQLSSLLVITLLEAGDFIAGQSHSLCQVDGGEFGIGAEVATQGAKIGFFVSKAIGFPAKDQADFELGQIVHIAGHLHGGHIYGFILTQSAGKGNHAIQIGSSGSQIGEKQGIINEVFGVHGQVIVVLFGDAAHDAELCKAEVVQDSGYGSYVSGVDGLDEDENDAGITS